jgi:2-aminoadipate transaminase
MNPLIGELQSSAIRDLLSLTRAPGMLSLAGGLPASDVFPVTEIAAAAGRLLAEQSATVLQYGPTEGDPRLREWVARYETRRCGRPVDPGRVLITSGSQQALDLIARTLCSPGNVIVVEEPGYLGALQALRAAGAVLEPVPVDSDGLDVEQLAARLAAGLRPVALYVVTTFGNPTGVTLSRSRRRRLGELAERYGFTVIEDDPYAELGFSTGPTGPTGVMPTVRTFTDSGVTLGSFSKTVTPGLRVGWAVLPDELVGPVTRLKQAADLHSGSLGQAIIAELVSDADWWQRHLAVIRQVYATRADALGAALTERFGGRLALNTPRGGMFLWGKFTDGTECTHLLAAALLEGVAFVPGQEFFSGPPDRSTLRLSYATLTPPTLVEAAGRLASAHARGRYSASSSAR